MIEAAAPTSSSAPGPADVAAPSNPRAWIMTGILTIAIAFGGFGTWATLASLDSAAIAPGVVVVESDRKRIQHLEGGLVREILVRDGDVVERGDLLIRLENTQTKAVYDIVRGELDASPPRISSGHSPSATRCFGSNRRWRCLGPRLCRRTASRRPHCLHTRARRR